MDNWWDNLFNTNESVPSSNRRLPDPYESIYGVLGPPGGVALDDSGLSDMEKGFSASVAYAFQRDFMPNKEPYGLPTPPEGFGQLVEDSFREAQRRIDPAGFGEWYARANLEKMVWEMGMDPDQAASDLLLVNAEVDAEALRRVLPGVREQRAAYLEGVEKAKADPNYQNLRPVEGLDFSLGENYNALISDEEWAGTAQGLQDFHRGNEGLGVKSGAGMSAAEAFVQENYETHFDAGFVNDYLDQTGMSVTELRGLSDEEFARWRVGWDASLNDGVYRVDDPNHFENWVRTVPVDDQDVMSRVLSSGVDRELVREAWEAGGEQWGEIIRADPGGTHVPILDRALSGPPPEDFIDLYPGAGRQRLRSIIARDTFPSAEWGEFGSHKWVESYLREFSDTADDLVFEGTISRAEAMAMFDEERAFINSKRGDDDFWEAVFDARGWDADTYRELGNLRTDASTRFRLDDFMDDELTDDDLLRMTPEEWQKFSNDFEMDLVGPINSDNWMPEDTPAKKAERAYRQEIRDKLTLEVTSGIESGDGLPENFLRSVQITSDDFFSLAPFEQQELVNEYAWDAVDDYINRENLAKAFRETLGGEDEDSSGLVDGSWMGRDEMGVGTLEGLGALEEILGGSSMSQWDYPGAKVQSGTVPFSLGGGWASALSAGEKAIDQRIADIGPLPEGQANLLVQRLLQFIVPMFRKP